MIASCWLLFIVCCLLVVGARFLVVVVAVVVVVLFPPLNSDFSQLKQGPKPVHKILGVGLVGAGPTLLIANSAMAPTKTSSM